MMDTSQEKRWKKNQALSWIVITCASVATYFVCSRLSVLAADDSFIHQRIAANLAHTGYAYFNPGEPVMATSSPLWTALLAMNDIFVPSTSLVPLFEAISVAIACCAGLLLVRMSTPAAAIRPKIALAAALSSTTLIWTVLLRSSIEQMETPLAVALLLSGLYALFARKIWGASLIVLAAFTRYEFMLALLLFFAVALWKRRLSVKSFVLAAVSAGMLVSWLWSQYHTVIPNTVRAKEAGYLIPAMLTIRGLEIRPLTAVLAVLGVALIFSTKRSDSEASLPSQLLMIFGGLVALVYLLKKTYVFPWYVPVYLAPVSLGLLMWYFGSHSGRRRIGIIFTISALMAVSVKGSVEAAVSAVNGTPWKDTNDVPGLRVGEYKMLGQAIYDACPSGTLMTSELGGLGAGFQGKILDGFGLVSPDAIKYHPMKIPEERSSGELGAIPVPFVIEKSPDVIVTYPQYGEDVLRQGARLGYSKFDYPPLLPADLSNVGSFYGIPNIYVLVKQGGRCSADTIDASIKRKISWPSMQHRSN